MANTTLNGFSAPVAMVDTPSTAVTLNEAAHNVSLGRLRVYVCLMDFWIPLLGGALGAALVNGIVAVYKLHRDREIEHEQWLRDQKVELYSNFLDAYTELYKQIQLAKDDGRMRSDLDPYVSQASPTRISLIAPDEIAAMANRIHQQLMWLVLALSLKPRPATIVIDERKYGEMSRTFETAVINDMRQGKSSNAAVEARWPRLKRAWAGTPEKRS